MIRAWAPVLIAGTLAGCTASPYDITFPAGPGPTGQQRYSIQGDIKSRNQDVVHRIVEGRLRAACGGHGHLVSWKTTDASRFTPHTAYEAVMECDGQPLLNNGSLSRR